MPLEFVALMCLAVACKAPLLDASPRLFLFSLLDIFVLMLVHVSSEVFFSLFAFCMLLLLWLVWVAMIIAFIVFILHVVGQTHICFHAWRWCVAMMH